MNGLGNKDNVSLNVETQCGLSRSLSAFTYTLFRDYILSYKSLFVKRNYFAVKKTKPYQQKGERLQKIAQLCFKIKAGKSLFIAACRTKAAGVALYSCVGKVFVL